MTHDPERGIYERCSACGFEIGGDEFPVESQAGDFCRQCAGRKINELAEAQRWRDAWGEPPTEHGEYLVVRQNYGGDYSRTVGKWDGKWPAYLAVTYWRPIGPLPSEGDEQ